MRLKPSKSNYPLVIIGVFLVGLVLAGGLLYGWINRASVADREQQMDFLNAAMRSFREELRAPLQEIRATFRPLPRPGTDAALEDYLARFYTQWRNNDANGTLVSGLSLATLDAQGKVHYSTLDAGSGKFRQEPLPPSLTMFRPALKGIVPHDPGRVLMFHMSGYSFADDGNRPVIVVPLLESGGRGRGAGTWAESFTLEGPVPPDILFAQREEHIFGPHEPGGEPGPETRVHPPFPGRLRGWCLLELNFSYLRQRVLPQLAERSFGGAGLSNYRVGVLAGDPSRVIFSSEPSLTSESFTSPDGRAVLFAPYGELGGLIRARAWRRSQRGGPHGPMDFSVAVPPPKTVETDLLPGLAGQRFPDGGAWVLAVKNKAGSIDAQVAGARRRNLALGFGVLFLLALSMGSLVITTHRARELARREMEFVAGVSHELRTPLASIQSAGFNLASGVVRKSSRVQEYGVLVQNEARRLTDMIEQVMSYAGIQSGGKRYEMVPARVPVMVDRALSEYGASFRDAGWQVEKIVDENLPLVLAEASSVESAVKNLFANAIKYGGDNRWLRVTAACAPNGGHEEVQISVEDHGPGIDPADLTHIFEPFYRGQEVLASTVPGAGLGLSIVKRHIEAQGGRVSVESTKGKGSRFTIHLPAVTEPERKAG